MKSVRIVADSGCDIPLNLAAKYEITVVPLMIRFGQESVWDSSITPAEFWLRQARSGQIPGTAAPPPSVFQTTYQRLIDAGHDVLCITLPANYSSIFNHAWLAAQEFGERVRVLDSGSISVGMGLEVLAAARQALDGSNLEALYRYLEGMRKRTSVIFVLDTLEWVRRGGRLNRLMPLIDRVARAFQIKPVIELLNGEVHLLGAVRSRRTALQRIEDEVAARMPVEALCTGHTRAQEAATELAGRLERLGAAKEGELVFAEVGPVFAAHAGPNAFGAAMVRA